MALSHRTAPLHTHWPLWKLNGTRGFPASLIVRWFLSKISMIKSHSGRFELHVMQENMWYRVPFVTKKDVCCVFANIWVVLSFNVLLCPVSCPSTNSWIGYFSTHLSVNCANLNKIVVDVSVHELVWRCIIVPVNTLIHGAWEYYKCTICDVQSPNMSIHLIWSNTHVILEKSWHTSIL